MSETNETKDNKEDRISEETSQRICTHMNDDHGVSVYAMAKSLLGKNTKITSATLKKVTMEKCTLSVVTCHGELCEMKTLAYNFEPRLKTASEVRSRLVAIHHQVCSPPFLRFVTDPLTSSVVVVMALLGYGTHVVGVDALATAIENHASLNSMISLVFYSATNFASLVRQAWFLGLFLHDLEAMYVLYQARTALKLNANAQTAWFLCCAAVGWPMTKEFMDLLRVHKKQLKTKNEKST